MLFWFVILFYTGQRVVLKCNWTVSLRRIVKKLTTRPTRSNEKKTQEQDKIKSILVLFLYLQTLSLSCSCIAKSCLLLDLAVEESCSVLTVVAFIGLYMYNYWFILSTGKQIFSDKFSHFINVASKNNKNHRKF